MRSFHDTLCGDAKAPQRVKAVNTLLNGGHNLAVLDDKDIDEIWESLFFALWHAEMGRGCEEIIAAIERACRRSYRLTRTGFRTIASKWYGLDQYRIDKISHLARHLLPVLIEHQVNLWFKSCKANRQLGTRDIYCKPLIKKSLKDIMKSYGLCYFILEILAEEVGKTLTKVYKRRGIVIGKFELKANLILCIYKQVIGFASDSNLDPRLLRTFDQYVIKKFFEELMPHESQLTQILITLRLYQNLERHANRKSNDKITSKSRALFDRWSKIIRDTHERCLDGEYFPDSIIPKIATIR